MFGSDIVSDLKNSIDEEDLAVVMRSKNHPRCVVEFISRRIQLLQIEEAKRCVMVNAALTISFISDFYEENIERERERERRCCVWERCYGKDIDVKRENVLGDTVSMWRESVMLSERCLEREREGVKKERSVRGTQVLTGIEWDSKGNTLKERDRCCFCKQGSICQGHLQVLSQNLDLVLRPWADLMIC